ncbi:MAG: hypothetical protein Q4D23_11065 [Bacteroidales bacterium]|nr:hypothetical protein [Bacteroidales bacterium]
MKTPNRVGYQLCDELCKILNHGNRMIEECGLEKPYHSSSAADWDNDGDITIEYYTTLSKKEKMLPALEKMAEELRAKGYLRDKYKDTHHDGRPWMRTYLLDYKDDPKVDPKVEIHIYLQHVPITVREKKGARLKVLTYEEYGQRLYAVKPKGKDELIRLYIWDSQLGEPVFTDNYERALCLQNNLDYIQDQFDKAMGEGRYVAFAATNFPHDRRYKPKSFNTFFSREGMKIGFSIVLQHYKVFCDEGFATITEEEYNRLKDLGIEEES